MLVHGDLHGGNLLLAHGRLSAVIDFGLLGLGDPACDAMAGWTVFGTGSRDRYRQAAGFDDATWNRGRGWALSMALIALPYYRDRDPAFAAQARGWLDAVLTEGG